MTNIKSLPKTHYLKFKHLHKKAEKKNKMMDERWKTRLTKVHIEHTIKMSKHSAKSDLLISAYF